MKYIVILGDGMADRPHEVLGGKTPLELADKPVIDYLASHGEMGLVRTVPEGMPPGSDVANLSVMGYDPAVYYSGRSPLEAASIGVDLLDTDYTFRCNLVTLSEEEPYEQKTMIDYSSDEITTPEAEELIRAVSEAFGTEALHFYRGRSYRHLLVWHDAPTGFVLTPPHDISERKITDYLPKGPDDVLFRMMKQSFELLRNHPVNLARKARGLRPANSLWFWGAGRKPQLTSFTEKYHLSGSVISAVDLVMGLGVCAGLDVVEVEGATGNIHTNFRGKGDAALRELLSGKDFVYVHIEAPDESGHRFEPDNKVLSITKIDHDIVKIVKEGLEAAGEDFAMLVMPDHPTPLYCRTHTSDPVPYVLYRSNAPEQHAPRTYTEREAAGTGIFVPQGYTMMDKLIKG